MLLPVVELCNAAATVAVIAYGGWLMRQRRDRTLGVLVAFLAYITRFFQPIRTLTQFYNQLQAANGRAPRRSSSCSTSRSLSTRPRNPVDAASTCWARSSSATSTFSYGREPVLQDVSFHAQPGEMIALVGHTGAGKTTIASLLARFYDPVEGAILLDGHDLRDLSFESLRHGVGLVLQDNFLFSGTIADNIRYANARRHATTRCAPRPRWPTRTTSSRACRAATTRRSWSARRTCRSGSAS